MSQPPVITLSICTRDRRQELVKTLKSVREIRCSAEWELLVVDNGRDDDGSCEMAMGLAPSSACAVRCVKESRPGVSYARNLALEKGGGELLIFIDDDVDCAPQFLEAHLQAFSDPTVHATGGRIIPRLPPTAPAWLREGLDKEVGGPTARYDFGEDVKEIIAAGEVRHPYTLPFTCNCGIRRGLALQVGGFRTDLGWTAEGKRIGGEDTDLFSRIGRLGGRMLYVPEACVVHRIREERTTRSYYRQWNIAYGRASIVMKGRPGFWKGAALICEQFIRYVRYSFMPARLVRVPVMRRYQKRYRALGKILEILRLR